MDPTQKFTLGTWDNYTGTRDFYVCPTSKRLNLALEMKRKDGTLEGK